MPILISKVAFSGVRNFTNNEHINVFMNMITNLTLIGLGFLRVLFSGGGVNLTAPSYFEKNLSNINITLYSC